MRVQQAIDDKAAEAVDLQLRVGHVEDRAGIPLDQQDRTILKQQRDFDKERLSRRLVLFDQGQPNFFGKERRLCCASVAESAITQCCIDLFGQPDAAFLRQSVIKGKNRLLRAFEEIGKACLAIAKANIQQRQPQRQQRRNGKG